MSHSFPRGQHAPPEAPSLLEAHRRSQVHLMVALPDQKHRDWFPGTISTPSGGCTWCVHMRVCAGDRRCELSPGVAVCLAFGKRPAGFKKMPLKKNVTIESL